MGKTSTQAAIDGTKEVAGAVLAATLTTIVVFLPILLIEDAAGQLFRDIALAIMAAVGLSLIVSLTLIPSASASWLSRRPRETKTVPIRPLWLRILWFPPEIPGMIAGSVRWFARVGGVGWRWWWCLSSAPCGVLLS